MKTAIDTSYKRRRLDGALDGRFDAIVVGSGAGGLSTAALLALDGRRVLVLERHAVYGGCLQVFRRNGYEWDVGLHYMGEVNRPESGLARLFAKVTRGRLDWAPMPEVYNRIRIGPRAFDYYAGIERFKDRMKGYFPEEAAVIDEYVDRVMQANRTAKAYFRERALPPSLSAAEHARVAPPFLAFAGKTVLETLREIGCSPMLSAVLCGHYGDYSLLPDRASFAVHAMVIRHYLEGASYPVGGAARIAETMADTVRAAGGEVLVAAEVEGLVVRGRRVHGVRMADGAEIEAPAVIGAGGIAQTLRLLDGVEDPGLDALRAGVRVAPRSQCYVVLNIGLSAGNDVLELDPANVWMHPHEDLVGNWNRHAADPVGQPMPLHFFSQPSAKDPSWPGRYPGRSTIDLCSLTDWALFEPFAGTRWQRRGEAYEALKHRLVEEMLEATKKVYPQVAGYLDHVELATPLSFNHFLNRDVGDFMSFAQTPERFAQRWMRAHSPLDGLYFAGQDVAAAGVSGAMVGGLVAASAVLGRDLFAELRG